MWNFRDTARSYVYGGEVKRKRKKEKGMKVRERGDKKEE